MSEPLDGAVLQGLYLALSENAQKAIFDAFGTTVVSGLKVSDRPDKLLVEIDGGVAILPARVGAIPGGVVGSLPPASESSVEGFASQLVIVGLLPYELADGYAIPGVLDDGAGNNANLPGGVPIAFVAVGPQAAEVIIDARQAVGQFRSITGQGISVENGGRALTGSWGRIEDLTLDLLTQVPYQKVEVRLYAQTDNVKLNERGLEIAMVVDEVDPIDFSIEYLAHTAEVPIGLSITPPVTGISEFAEHSDLSSRNPKLSQSDSDPPGPGQYFVNEGTGVYTFNVANVGLAVTIKYGQRPVRASGLLVPPGWGFNLITGLFSASHVIEFPTPGHHTLELVARGKGKVGKIIMMARTERMTPER